MPERFISQAKLKEICPFSRSTIWRWERAGKFPKRRQISRGRVGWLASEIDAFLIALPTAATKALK